MDKWNLEIFRWVICSKFSHFNELTIIFNRHLAQCESHSLTIWSWPESLHRRMGRLVFYGLTIFSSCWLVLRCLFHSLKSDMSAVELAGLESVAHVARKSLKSLLRICRTEAQFQHTDGSLYCQKEGVANGSPLGPTVANFYMAVVEKQVLLRVNIRPSITTRFVDDICVVVRDKEHLKQL